MTKVYTIIVTYNGMRWIKHCLDCLNESTVKTDILIIDNMSTDGTLQFVKESYPDVECFPQERNLGFGQANNVGLRYALEHGADYCLLLNQDAYLQPTAIEQMLAQSDGKSLLSPLHLNGDGTRLDYMFRYTLRNAHNQMADDLLIRHKLEPRYEIGDVAAACWLMPVSIIKEIGGFNPLFFHYSEDNNYTQRMHYHGIKTWLVPHAFMCHDRKEIQGNMQVFNHHRLRRDMLLIACDINKSLRRRLLDFMLLLFRQYAHYLPKRQYRVGYYTVECLWIIMHASSIERSRRKEKLTGATWL